MLEAEITERPNFTQEILDRDITGYFNSPAAMESYFTGRNLTVFKLNGDCLSGKGLPDQSLLVFDLGMQPYMGDVTLAEIDETKGLYAKIFYGPSFNAPGTFLVGTCYRDKTRNRDYHVSRVCGTAIACFGANGDLLWKKRAEPEDEIELAHRANSRYLLSKGIEPTEDALAKLEADIMTWVETQTRN
jgi:hypothetical protein